MLRNSGVKRRALKIKETANKETSDKIDSHDERRKVVSETRH